MGATACFNGSDSGRLESLVACQEFSVLSGENVVGDRAQLNAVSKMTTELKHEGCFAASYGAPDANGKRALMIVSVERLFTVVKVARVIGVFVSVPVVF